MFSSVSVGDNESPLYRKDLTMNRRIVSSLLAGALVAGAAFAAPAENPNFDARISNEKAVAKFAPSAAQLDAAKQLRAEVQELNIQFADTGVTSKLSNHTGYLTDAIATKGSVMDKAVSFVNENLDLLGLQAQDLEGFIVTDDVYSQLSGVRHIYLGQTFQGIQIYNAQLHINIDRDGKILSINNSFVPGLAANKAAVAPTISAVEAVMAAADFSKIAITELPTVAEKAQFGPEQRTLIDASSFAYNKVEPKLMWLPNGRELNLVWNFQIEGLDGLTYNDYTVDAVTGDVWTSFTWAHNHSYRVYEAPVEDPEATTPLPPSDGRTLVVNPENSTASPNGWFSGTGIMDGNNVHACADQNANNGCDSGQPSCTSGVCDFPINLSSAPSNSIAAAITNLFYWNNHIHDVQYQYGFDEPGGNFQENNFGRGGAGSDSVNADALDGSGNCNANFSTPTDGGNPRMQMFTCTNASPARDGDYDNGVIVHEYGHGISIRQVGGPGNSSCLNNTQQAGEGWSDVLGLMYTALPSDTGAKERGLGAYLFNTAVTIRDLPYSTSSSSNNWTYESINGASVPHGVGSRWAQAAWEVYWKLVDKWGFEQDLINFNINDSNEAGNKRAMYYINEGLKNTACSPTFVDNRDGIIQAATSSFGGADVCDVWEAFAAFGLGTDAVSGGSNSRNPTNGFSVPTSCSGGGGGGGGGGGTPGTCDGTNCIDWDVTTTSSFATQDASSSFSVSNGGDTITLTNNTWRQTNTTFTVTANTVVEFDFSSTSQGEIHGVGFDNDNTLSSDRIFKVHGTQNYGITDFDNYGSGTTTYSIPVGQYFTGSNMNLILVNDNDAGSGNNSVFTNVRVFENGGGGGGGGGGGTCSYDNDFEGGDTTGWANASGSTCTTGAYIIGNPTQQTSTVVTQPNGSASGTSSIFTASNTAAGTDDVDGGNCILTKDAISVGSSSTLSFNYFHGQRDAGDDASGDFFNVQYRVNGGSWVTVVSNGDSQSAATWTAASATVPAGNVELRMQCSDGSGPGDIVECGIDDVKICN